MKDKRHQIHSVCTFDEAAGMVKTHRRFWISDCSCQEEEYGCLKPKVCLLFKSDKRRSGPDFRRVDRDFAEDILREAESKHLVPMPFHDQSHPDKVLGICFFYLDSVSGLLDTLPVCGRGEFIELTDREACIACGSCQDVCYFGARTITDNELVVDRGRCYGCGLCQTVCPMHCIRMIPRKKDDG